MTLRRSGTFCTSNEVALSPPASREASVSACCQHGATRPKVSSPHWQHSPIAEMCGSAVCSCGFTRIPRSHGKPDRCASAMFGRTPTESTTRSAAIPRPSLRFTLLTLPAASALNDTVSACKMTLMPRNESPSCNSFPACSSSC
ncbi:hypothetical protein SM39_1882 [Serratia marcescens SM39]|uniref:Uncharacterized protein n=1 Tax=Serratia marcescens SM39 TaxID=1334564 RepID=A0AAT9DXV0_SERMA|nr:hypothetical protein SM39_1882 [Serratia marcescens SM39]